MRFFFYHYISGVRLDNLKNLKLNLIHLKDKIVQLKSLDTNHQNVLDHIP